MTEPRKRKIPDFAAVLLVALSFWPVWIWFIERFNDKSDEPLGLLALLTFVAVYFSRTRPENLCSSNKISLKPVIALIAFYVLANNQLPALIKAAIAVTCLVLVLRATIGRGRMFAGDWFLIYLSLPLVASFNFYAGYPLRLLCAQISTVVLNVLGMRVSQEGTLLGFGGNLVQIDAPCSGIKMMWLALYLMALFLSHFKVGTGRALLLLATAVVAAVVANTARVILLFLIEMHIFEIPPGNDELVHQLIGLATFSLLALVVGFAANTGKERIASVEKPGSIGGTSDAFAFKQPAEAVRVTFAGTRVLAAVCVIAAGVPLLSEKFAAKPATRQAVRAFPGWPETFEGRILTALPDGDSKGENFASFPGKLKALSDGKRIILMRWVTQPTRQLHPASDCYRALGYEVEFEPLLIDGDGKRWSCFSAKRGKIVVFVRERIADENGRSWSDASSWYWSAMLGSTQAPWWSITVEDENRAFSGKNRVSKTVSGAESTPETPY